MSSASYEIEVGPTGGIDVLRNQIGWRYDLDDVEEALAEIRAEVGPGYLVTLVDPSGYREELGT